MPPSSSPPAPISTHQWTRTRSTGHTHTTRKIPHATGRAGTTAMNTARIGFMYDDRITSDSAQVIRPATMNAVLAIRSDERRTRESMTVTSVDLPRPPNSDLDLDMPILPFV